MKKVGGVWTATLELAPGRYAYKFVVNPEEIPAKETWFTDPTAPQTPVEWYGKTNAIVKVKTLKKVHILF